MQIQKKNNCREIDTRTQSVYENGLGDVGGGKGI